MKTLLTLLLTLFFVTSANAGMKSSYELNQPIEIIIMRLSVPGADKVLTRKNGGELISKELTGVSFIISDKFTVSMTYDKVIKRDDRLLKFKEVVLSKDGSVVTTTNLVSKDSVVDKYILVTTFKRSPKDTTLVEHELVYHKDGLKGFGKMISQRIILVKIQKGIRYVVGEIKKE
jgi:hypothetical protein